MKIHCKFDDLIDPKKLKNHPKNRNKHGQDQVERLAEMYKYHGIRHPIIVSNLSQSIVAGHGRKLAAIRAGVKEMPVVYQDFESTEAEYAFIQADNAIALWAELDLAGINSDIGDLGPDFDINMLGIQDFTLDVSEKDEKEVEHISLADKFLIPPFSYIDTRQGYFTDRTRQWLALGIESEVGRNEGLTFNAGDDFLGKENAKRGTTSIFNPTICEIAYKWFCPSGGKILDPFAGGSVRGIVAEKLGYQYHGNDLRKEQIEENIKQGEKLGLNPKWYYGDSNGIQDIIKERNFDLVMSCPPYADLEVYSDDAKDISNMEYDDFLRSYENIINKSVEMLNDNSFIFWVVGEVRSKDKNGSYKNFVGDTILAFQKAGVSYYNEIILINQSGTGALRANKQFSSSRKVVKMHQNILVFVKGNAKKATEKIGEIEIMDLEASNE